MVGKSHAVKGKFILQNDKTINVMKQSIEIVAVNNPCFSGNESG